MPSFLRVVLYDGRTGYFQRVVRIEDEWDEDVAQAEIIRRFPPPNCVITYFGDITQDIFDLYRQLQPDSEFVLQGPKYEGILDDFPDEAELAEVVRAPRNVPGRF